MTVTKPIIELKKIHIHVGLSEETPAYTARLFVDGKHFADVSNQGHGGPDMVYSPKLGLKQHNDPDFDASLTALEKRIGETFPKRDCEWGDKTPFDESLEVLCHTAVWLHVDQRNVKSRLSRTIMTLEDGKTYSYKGKKTEERMDALAKQKPTAIILNRLAFSAAWELLQQAA